MILIISFFDGDGRKGNFVWKFVVSLFVFCG